MDYREQLQDIRWLQKRTSILERDLYRCQHCLSRDCLNVHHRLYIKGRMAWEYADWYLITLCDDCHNQWHRENNIKVLDEGDKIVDGFWKIRNWIEALGDNGKV